MKFSEIIEQEPAKKFIQDAISGNRLAHAIMLTGPEGVGQMAIANALAQYVNCLQPKEGDSCGRCTNCIKIRKGIHPDVRFILPIISKTEGGRRYLTEDYFDKFRKDFFENPYYSFSQWQRSLGGENKQLRISVHEIRDLKRKIYLKAFEAPFKLVILWRAELINTEGANAFLKLLEEPPDRTLIILTCSDPGLLLSTINSRVQRIYLSRIPSEAIQRYLIQERHIPEERAAEVASISEGSMSNAQEYLTEHSQNMSELYMNWLRAVYTGHFDKISEQIDHLTGESKEYQKLFLQIAIKKIRDSLMYQLHVPQLARVTESEKTFQEKFSQFVSGQKVNVLSTLLEESYRHISGNANAQMVFTDLSMQIHRILRSP